MLGIVCNGTVDVKISNVLLLDSPGPSCSSWLVEELSGSDMPAPGFSEDSSELVHR